MNMTLTPPPSPKNGKSTSSSNIQGPGNSGTFGVATPLPSLSKFPVWLNYGENRVKEFRKVFELKYRSGIPYVDASRHDDFGMQALWHAATETTKEKPEIDFEFLQVVTNCYPDEKNPGPVSDALDKIDERYKDALFKRKMDMIDKFCSFSQEGETLKRHVQNWMELKADCKAVSFGAADDADFSYYQLLKSLRPDITEKVILKGAQNEADVLKVLSELMKVESLNDGKSSMMAAVASKVNTKNKRNHPKEEKGNKFANIVCFECKEKGHFKSRCPSLKQSSDKRENKKSGDKDKRNKSKDKKKPESKPKESQPVQQAQASVAVRLHEWSCCRVKVEEKLNKNPAKRTKRALMDSGASKPILTRDYDEYMVPGSETEQVTEFKGASDDSSFTTYKDATYILPLRDRFRKIHRCRIRAAVEDKRGAMCILPPPDKFEMDRKLGVHKTTLGDLVIEGTFADGLPLLEVVSPKEAEKALGAVAMVEPTK